MKLKKHNKLQVVPSNMINEMIDDIQRTHNSTSDETPNTKDSYTQWGISEGSKYFPTFSTRTTIERGFYELGSAQNIGVYLEKRDFLSDELYSLPSKELTDIINDIEFFWNNSEVYEEYNFIHKRGILLYGKPGCGKSAIIQLCTKYLLENENGIVINISNIDQMEMYSSFIGKLRQVEPNRPLIVIMEDVDSLVDDNSWSTSMVLNVLDGVKQVDNVVYIATTNYPEKLQERVSNRPSRFDRRYEITLPNEEIRREYLKHKLKENDLKNIDIDQWVEQSDGFSISHLKELVVSVVVMKQDFDKTIERLRDMEKTPEISSGKISVGFG